MQIVQGEKVIDPATGEVATEIDEIKDLVLQNRDDPIAQLIADSGSVPIHLAMARKLGIPAHIVSTYVGNPPSDPNDYLNQKIYLTGAIVYFSGRFTPKVTDPTQPGYKDGSGFYTFLMKTSMTKTLEYRVGKQVMEAKIPIVLKCDGVKIRDTIMQLIQDWSWYDWKDAVTGDPIQIPVVFTRGGPNNSFFVQILPE